MMMCLYHTRSYICNYNHTSILIVILYYDRSLHSPQSPASDLRIFDECIKYYCKTQWKMASSKYVVRNLWDKAPVLTKNLLGAGVVDTAFNATLTKAAVTAFDEYTSIRRGTGFPSSAASVDESMSKSGTTRRRRRTFSPRQGKTESTTRPRLGKPDDNGNLTLTDNDFFFEHQKTRGYRLAAPAIADCDCTRRLQEDFLVDAVAYYLEAVCGAKLLADQLLLGTGELSIDMWAAVQRGKGAYHADHVHEGALVSGVYYAAVPYGSAPLVLRRPKADETRMDEAQTQSDDISDDAVISPTEGHLILFPPWVEHGVPFPEEQHNVDSNNLPRVSFAFNVTGAFTLGSDPWNITRLAP